MATPLIALLNGPNLNLLGEREPDVYGRATLADVVRAVEAKAGEVPVEHFQTNCEGALVDAVQRYGRSASGIILNAGGYTHTSVALRDAVQAVPAPTIEVHVSNVYAREEFRRHSYLSGVARGVIVGFGVLGYELAVEALLRTCPDLRPENPRGGVRAGTS